MAFEEKYLYLLQNLEFAIVSVYKEKRDLLDIEVMDALQALINHYRSEEIKKESIKPKLSDKAETVFYEVLEMSEGRLNRKSKYSGFFKDSTPTSLQDIITCLKTILSSAKKWNKELGKQGYLSFVSKFVK